MKVKVNDRGWAALKAWIEATRGEDDFGFLHSTTDMDMEYWCRDVEASTLIEGECFLVRVAGKLPIAVMGAGATRSGREESFTLSEDMLTVCDEEAA